MNTKEIKIPIYNKRVVLFKNTTTEEALNYFGLEPRNGFAGGVFYKENDKGIRKYGFVLEADLDYSKMAHESFHLSNYILSHIGAEPSFINDEPQAYLIQYIFNEAIKFYE